MMNPSSLNRRLAAPAVGAREVALLTLVAFAALGVGCTGSVGSSESALFMSEAPLSQVGLADVETASSSCEGMLTQVTDFAILGETGLIVGLDAGGGAICIDTVDAVNAELGEVGRVGDAMDLVSRYETTMALRAPHEGSNATFRRYALAGDPDPEPNSPQYSQQGQSQGPGI